MSSWRIAFASATGTSHLKLNKGCDDSCSAEIVTTKDGEVAILCVADGAGTAGRSAEGAREVCNSFLSLCTAILESGSTFAGATEHTIREDWIGKLRDALVSKACDEGADLRDFATTFLGAVLTDDHCIFLQIGDGAIVASEVHAPEDYTVICWPQHGEYANTTSFLTDIDAVAAAHITTIQRAMARVIIFSDGMERLLLDFANHCAAPRPISQLISPLLAIPQVHLNESLQSFLESSNVNARTDDDKSLVLAARY
jgi:hypothetical protein